ncbi:cupredoxin domain-containing protein [Rhodopila sp.]|uniref:cupredoxin domain-containing protein n=1 Tax=Rhodopila sp. TaxID=2480087 RepID=UPI003D0D98CB
MKAVPCLALAALGVAVVVTAGAADRWSGATKLTVVMVDNRFEPDHLTFQHGKAYELVLENRGKDMHEFTAPGFLKAATIRDKRALSSTGDIVVQSGNTARVFLIAPPKGHYDLTCADHDWDGMVGSIAVN